MVRSPHAHARIVRIDTAPALATPGVLAVLDGRGSRRGRAQGDVASAGADESTRSAAQESRRLAVLRRAIPCRCPSIASASSASPSRWSSPRRRSPRATAPSGSPWSGSRCRRSSRRRTRSRPAQPPCGMRARRMSPSRREAGDAAATDAAFARAAHVVTPRYPHQPRDRRADGAARRRRRLRRVDAGATPSTRDQAGRGGFAGRRRGRPRRAGNPSASSRAKSAAAMARAIPAIRSSAGRVGGQARRRPVKWTGDRRESLISDCHARDLVVHAELALDADGTFLAYRASTRATSAHTPSPSSRSPRGSGSRPACTTCPPRRCAAAPC